MPPYYDDNDDYRRSRSRGNQRDRSPDYYYSGGAPPAFSSGAIPVSSHARLDYAPQSPFYSPNASTSNLRPDDRRYRPRSMPPPSRDDVVVVKGRKRSRSPQDPIGKARQVFKENFSNSTSGLGIGILGAVVGGLAAREVVEANTQSKSRSGRRQHSESHLLSTLVGAAVGGFGANALEKKLNAAKEKNAEQQDRWEQKFGRDDQGDRDRGRGRSRRRSGDDDEYDYVYDTPRTRSRRTDARY